MNKLVIFISGSGTNLQAIIDAIKERTLSCKIIRVVSNKKNAGGLQRAEKAGIPAITHCWSRKTTKRVDYDMSLLEYTKDADLVVLAGWMHILSEQFLQAVKPPIINLHPALPGTFKGADGIGMAWDAFQRGEITVTGVMVHHVVPEVDSGKVIYSRRVYIDSNDTLESLREKVRTTEKPVLIEAIRIVTTKLPLLHTGKVRDVYDVGNGVLQMVATDRCSSFDRHICNVPYKGYYLTRQAKWWFDQTTAIIPNHYITSHDNSMFVRRTEPIPIEVVVRGYITGSTRTSLWKNYSNALTEEGESFKGLNYCGHYFPPGLEKNDRLPYPVITPTTKDHGGDEPLSAEEIVEKGILSKSDWKYISSRALELFQYGQWLAEQRGLILVDTKYEFGRVCSGEIILIDELHTCDSSRYWLLDESRRLDKDVVREWVVDQCDPYTVAEIPVPPPDVVHKLTSVYKEVYERLNGQIMDLPQYSWDYRFSLKWYVLNKRTDQAVIIVDPSVTTETIRNLEQCLTNVGVYSQTYSASIYTTAFPDCILDHHNDNLRTVYIVCVESEWVLGSVVSAHTSLPVLLCPLITDDIHSIMNTPPEYPCMIVTNLLAAANAARRIIDSL